MDTKACLTPYSQSLRKNMTKEERHLWYDFLKTLPLTVHRQKVIGAYIADFYIANVKIAIELDGSQHFEEEGQNRDFVRDRFFASKKIKVLRYSNYDINNSFDAVCQDILNNIKDCGGV
jgi:very-short-patch-repair endonuclease